MSIFPQYQIFLIYIYIFSFVGQQIIADFLDVTNKREKIPSCMRLLLQVLWRVSAAMSPGDLTSLPPVSGALWPQESGAFLQCGKTAGVVQSPL